MPIETLLAVLLLAAVMLIGRDAPPDEPPAIRVELPNYDRRPGSGAAILVALFLIGLLVAIGS